MTRTHTAYLGEAAERMPIIDVADVERGEDVERLRRLTASLDDKTVMLIAETAYRRGFQQGAALAVDAVFAEGLPIDQLQDWVGLRLHGWRFSRHDGQLVPPPTP